MTRALTEHSLTSAVLATLPRWPAAATLGYLSDRLPGDPPQHVRVALDRLERRGLVGRMHVPRPPEGVVQWWWAVRNPE